MASPRTRITQYSADRSKSLSKARLQLVKAQQVREALDAIANLQRIRPPTSSESLGSILRAGVAKRDAAPDTADILKSSNVKVRIK